jgi:hypothetical protein
MPLVLLNPECYEDPRFREAAIIIKLTQKELDEQEARTLAQHTHQLAEEVPQTYGRVLPTMSTHRSSGSAIEPHLLATREGVPATEWETRQIMVQSLTNSSRYRTSQLRVAWPRLNLPPRLHDIVRV